MASNGNRTSFHYAVDNQKAVRVTSILKRYGWGIDKVKKHQDFSGKYCPHRTLDLGWERFFNMIKNKLNNVAIEGNKMSNTYKGLDLGNPDSMKVAVDIWYEVMQEKK